MIRHSEISHGHIDGLVQDCSNSIANVLESLRSCTKPSIMAPYSFKVSGEQTETDMPSFWYNFHHWLHRKLLFWQLPVQPVIKHYGDVIMGAITSQITSLMIVYSTVYSDADQRKHQSAASLAFVRGIHRGPVNSPHKWPATRKLFPFDDVIMKFVKMIFSFQWQPYVALYPVWQEHWQKCLFYKAKYSYHPLRR